MQNLFLVKSNQLFENILLSQKPKETEFLYIESHYIAKKYRYIKQKLVFLYSAMRTHAKFFETKGFKIKYFTLKDNFGLKEKNDFILRINEVLKSNKYECLNIFEDTNIAYEKLIEEICKKHNVRLIIHQNPMFLGNRTDYLNPKTQKAKKINFMPFYISQRKKLKILIDSDKKPIGGKWSFDNENRKKLAKNIILPQENLLQTRMPNKIESEVILEINQYFPNNPGFAERIWLPIDFESTKIWFENFLKNSFNSFGEFEDAIEKDSSILFHSVLSPMLNIGLITPDFIVNKAIKYSKEYKIPFNSLEGFIRQIIGWREYMYLIYLNKGKELRNSNFLNLTKKIPKSFYTGETGIEPIDVMIKKTNNNGYLHHIERLMIMGNFMLLGRFEPIAVYNWFMEMFIDAYPWVMIPNIMGMSQFSASTLIITKPYISSSNYILKMSNFKKGDWALIWDSMYWSFLIDFKSILKSNPRMSLIYKILEKKSDEELNKIRNSNTFV